MFVAICVAWMLSGDGGLGVLGDWISQQDPSRNSAEEPSFGYVDADQGSITVSDVPEYSGEASVTIAGGEPGFEESEITTTAFESYGELDDLGRCTVATACIGPETMPTEERGDISGVRPSGWVQESYGFIDGGYLYNRCHLIGYRLTGENDNVSNLITGTRYMNTEGMLPYEDMVDDYVDSTGNHVMYRVTPIFEGDELVARGVQIEALSVEDGGAGISFNVYCYNVQPGVEIDYASGVSWEA